MKTTRENEIKNKLKTMLEAWDKFTLALKDYEYHRNEELKEYFNKNGKNAENSDKYYDASYIIHKVISSIENAFTMFLLYEDKPF